MNFGRKKIGRHSRLASFAILALVIGVLFAGDFVLASCAVAGTSLAMVTIVSPRTQRSQLWQTGHELQDYGLYSLITLPAAINPANGNLFFGDTETTVGRQRTNLTRPGEVPGKTNFEIFGIGIKFLAPLTVLYTSFQDAIRDAWIQFQVNNAERWVRHLSEFIPATVTAPSFSAAAGDNPVITHQGLNFTMPVDPTIVLQGGVNFTVRIFFFTNVAALGNTVVGVYFTGLLDRGAIQLDQQPLSVPAARFPAINPATGQANAY